MRYKRISVRCDWTQLCIFNTIIMFGVNIKLEPSHSWRTHHNFRGYILYRGCSFILYPKVSCFEMVLSWYRQVHPCKSRLGEEAVLSRLYQRALSYISLSLLHLFYSTQAALSWSVRRPGICLFWLLMLHPDIWSWIIVHPWDSACPLLSLHLFLVSMPSCLLLVHFSVHCGRCAALQRLWTHSFHLVREGSRCPLESIVVWVFGLFFFTVLH